MNVKDQIFGSQEKETAVAAELETLEPELVKKQQISNPTEIKVCVKIHTTDGSGKIQQKQENIMQEMENANIFAFVEEQMAKFEPPYCDNCPKRRTDRVCVHKKCGDKYMQLICGKCHFDIHKDTQTKPEIDIQEYFTKLATFLNSQQHQKKKQSQTLIDTEILSSEFNMIKEIHEKLDNFKSKLTNEVEGYQSPSEIHAILQKGITKALTIFEVENVQEQLDIIKKNILFLKNKFVLNDASKKFESFSEAIRKLEKLADTMSLIITKSFVGDFQINFSELQCLASTGISLGYGGLVGNNYQTKIRDNEITLTNRTNAKMQIYLDYKLDITKKYKLRFRFDQKPMKCFMVGVMPYSMIQNCWVYNIPGQYFSKRFLSKIPNYECSRIIRGADLCDIPQKDMTIQMRIDFSDNYVYFADYPDFKNVNANRQENKFSSQGFYVLAFAFFQQNQITLESLEETSSIDQY